MRSLDKFRRMLGVLYVYAAKLIIPERKKQLPPAQTYLRLEAKSEK